ncbi:M48 family metallopeptidase [Streptomyces macrosporus]|uniref:M48 family metallopeptidase n=1 Tax=Streptomyces macrosporus TaxID=44032 RepID=A0ABN3KCK3_9ACTN
MRAATGAALRTVLAFVLVAGFHVLSSALVLLYCAYTALVGWVVLVDGTRLTSPTPLYPVAFGAPAVAAVLRGMFAGVRTPAPGRDTVAVDRKRAPELWRTVAELARAVGAPEPTEIRLTLEANASVSEERRRGLPGRTRRLEIGVPLLAGLRADELRAVLCHELGHYARRHTRFAATAHRGSYALRRARADIAEAAVGNPMVAAYTRLQFRLLGAYAWLYDAVTFGVRRRQEFQADAAAAAVAGREATASALTAVHAVGAAWEDFRARFLDPMAEHGRTPDDPLRPFALMLTDPDYAEALEEWRRRPEPPRSRLDSHPPLGRRLAALDRCPRAATVPDPRPGWTLLGEDASLPAQVWHSLLRGLVPLAVADRRAGQPWEEWLDDAAEAQVVRAVEDLRGPLALLGGPPDPTLDALLDLLAAERGAELAGALYGTEWGADRWGDGPGTPVQALVTLVGQGLVVAGRAGWTVRWTGPAALIVYDAEAREAMELARAAVTDPDVASRLRAQLVLCGVNTAIPLDRTGPLSRSGGPRPTRPPGPARRRAGWPLVAMGVIVVVFGWSVLGGGDEPERFRPGIPVTGYTTAPPGPTGFPDLRLPTAVPSAPPVPVLPSATCGPGESAVGNVCVPLDDLFAPPDVEPPPQR